MFELFMLKLKYLDSLSVLWQLIDHMMFDLDKRLICISNKYLKLCWIKFIMQIFITHNFDRYNYLWRIKGRWRGSPPPTLFEHLHVVFLIRQWHCFCYWGSLSPPLFSAEKVQTWVATPFWKLPGSAPDTLKRCVWYSYFIYDIVHNWSRTISINGRFLEEMWR